MSKIKFHRVAAVLVLVVSAAWVLTGDFSSVGSASTEESDRPRTVAEIEIVPQTVAVVTPPRAQHRRAIRLSGLTEADKRASLATRAGGIIGALPIEQGSSIKAGELILSLDATDKSAAIETARKLLVQRRAEAEAAERLVQRGSMAKLQADNARSALAAAESQLETAVMEMDRMVLRAPFDGIVDRVLVEQGSSVQQGAQAAVILSLDPIIATGEVSERDLAFIKNGDKADIRLVSGQIVKGTIRYISREASAQTRTFRVEVAVPNPDGLVPAGMTAEITLWAEPVDAVILPRSVVTLGARGDLGIRGVDAESKVEFYAIDLVDDTPGGLVLAGIPENKRIIVAGQDLVSDGDKVNAVEADAATIERLVGEVTGGAVN